MRDVAFWPGLLVTGRTTRRAAIASAIAVSTTLLGCGGPSDPPPLPAAASVVVTPTSATLVSVGETSQLSATARDANGNSISGKTFTWSSSDVMVATVSSAGLVTAVANGAATITATADGVSDAAAITVAQVVAAVVVTPAIATVNAIGAMVAFSAVPNDAQGNAVAGSAVTWASSDMTIATVDATGLATAVGVGTVTVTATAATIDGTAMLAITPPIATVEITPTNPTLNAVGATVLLVATAKETTGLPIPNAIFAWASADLTIATVDGTGLVTATGIGTTTVTATSDTASGVSNLNVVQVGTGTGTLLVIASVTANDLPGGLFTTNFLATVSDAAMMPVSGAIVTITHATLGVVTLIETMTLGTYSAVAASFPGGAFELDVVTATDSVKDVIARGPGVHTITTPLANTTVTANQPLLVSWTRPLQAGLAEVESRDFPNVSLPDTGALAIPAINNPPTNNQRIRVHRTNKADAAGGLMGSQLSIKIRAQVEPVIAAASLTFSGDATFQGPHPAHPIKVAVVRVGTGVVALASGTVSGTANPSFSFSFPGVLLEGEAYEVHYWIDSNFGGGTLGVCDPPTNDHQWKVVLAALTGPDMAITEVHNAAIVTDVCGSFP